MTREIVVTVEGAGIVDRAQAMDSAAMALAAAGWVVVARVPEHLSPSAWSARLQAARKAAGLGGRIAIIKTKAAPLPSRDSVTLKRPMFSGMTTAAPDQEEVDLQTAQSIRAASQAFQLGAVRRAAERRAASNGPGNNE